ncbi:hypothetical protein BC938DRAFT_479386 [Jimgerdemannia flammicorona]|uniref:Uncharacterized protein n=1 Tax=Jimgerdemannia flammicorona TaxID=994334 RepID=A0A433QL00_9FUNG|nr:hypothetical protein BC938DRAFT_479386 [Jimgerdemannia flammicorona]
MSSPLFTMKNGPYHTGSKAHSKCRICFEIVRMRDITVLSVRYIKKYSNSESTLKWYACMMVADENLLNVE